MCGVAGILRLDSEPVDRAALERMTQALAHRGPDGHGIWIDGPIGLGHRRLAIRDLSDAGRQPMTDPDGEIVVSYNGEIYNDVPLREEIRRATGHAFRSGCDAEILPLGWRIWGEELFERIEGMFAIALWDARDRSLVLARDGVGIKPLYHAHSAGRLLFASEVKGLLACGDMRPRVDAAAFHGFLASGYAEPEGSLLEDIEQVPAGTVLTQRGGRRMMRRFWQPARRATIEDEREACQHIEATLSTVCEQMRVADVPAGLLLSSGIDSALLATMARASLPCYTAWFEERSHDECADAERIAKFTGNPWSRVRVAGDTSLAEDFLHMVEHVDGQLADSSALAHFSVSRAVRREVKVALAGDGADEFFGGYPTYRASLVAQHLHGWVPRRAGTALGRLLGRRFGGSDESRMPWHELLARFVMGLSNAPRQPHAEWRRLAMPHLLPELYGAAMQPLLGNDPLHTYRARLDETHGTTLDRCLVADQRHYLPADMLMKVDRMSMAHGLEIRVPFLDRRVMDLAGSIAGPLLIRATGPSKRVLRALARDSGLPADIVRARKKGFNVPVARTLRGELRPLCERLLDREADLFEPLLRPDAIRRLWNEHRSRQLNHGYLLWTLLVWGAWRQRHDIAS